jgi:hypothetical protein
MHIFLSSFRVSRDLDRDRIGGSQQRRQEKVMQSSLPASKFPKDASTTSSPDFTTLVERFDEPPRGGTRVAPTAANTGTAASGPRLARPQVEGASAVRSAAPPPSALAAKKRAGLSRNGLISALVVAALVPLAILFVQLWQDMMRSGGDSVVMVVPAEGPSMVSSPVANSLVRPKQQSSSALEVALSSPDRIDAKAGEAIAFPIVIDATAALPARSIVTITALPEGASFSEGRPFGDNGWSLLPGETGDLQLRLPAGSGALAMRLELVAGDGTVLAQSETQLSVAPGAAKIAMADAVDGAASEQVAQAEQTGSVADTPPLPQRNPSTSAGHASAPKVNTVKVVTIKPPSATRPHDGAYGLGSPDEPQAPAEWMVTKTAVDMHAKAQQSSETVKVAEGGIKVRVMARDKNWVQVTDPASSTTGWIYNRFLKPAEPAAQ